MSEPVAPPPPPPPSWAARVFAASWLSYFSYYFTRMPFKATKTSLQAEHGLTKADLNVIETAYNVAYCLGQVVNGFLADWLGPRRWVAFGMLLSAALVFAFQLADSITGTLLGVYTLIWGLNGFAQSTGWPGNSKVMASWFSTRRRGEVLGYWSTCYQAGGMVATLVAARLLDAFGWRGVYVGMALWVTVVAVAFFALVRDRPSSVGFANPDSISVDREERRRLLAAEWPRVLRTPMVWSMSAAYFCCKLIRYSFLFWLPFYLETALGYTKVQSLDTSIFFELGGLIFVMVAGHLADRVFQRRRVATAFGFLLLLVGALFLYREIGDQGRGAVILGLMLVGGTLFAADSLISGAVAQDLGGPHAAALASGLINGVGSIGQVLQGFLLVYITDHYGWLTLFDCFAGLAAFGALMCVPYLRVKPAAAA